MRRLFSIDGPLPPILLPLGAAIIALAAARGPAHAQETPAAHASPKTASFVIAQAEGYGIADCFRSGSSCGQVVSDSWCETNGWGKAIAWGAAEDMTASLGTSAPVKATKGSFVVTCGE